MKWKKKTDTLASQSLPESQQPNKGIAERCIQQQGKGAQQTVEHNWYTTPFALYVGENWQTNVTFGGTLMYCN